MPNVSINELSHWTGKNRATIAKALDGIEYFPGPTGGKLYPSRTALEKLYHASTANGGTFINKGEADRQLVMARKEQIHLEMEVTRGQRWPKPDVEEIHEKALFNVAGLIKAHEGKVLNNALIQDLFTELRGVGAALAELGRQTSKPVAPVASTNLDDY